VNGEEVDAPPQVFKDVRAVREEMKRKGYDEIEYQQSAEVVDDVLDGSGYTFTSEGARLDADAAA
jgi:hypothetical protein